MVYLRSGVKAGPGHVGLESQCRLAAPEVTRGMMVVRMELQLPEKPEPGRQYRPKW